MNEDNRKRIQGNYELLIENLDVLEIDAYLYQEGVLSQEDRNLVDHEKRRITRQESAREFLNIILKAEIDYYSIFLAALRRNVGLAWIVDALDATDTLTVKLKPNSDYMPRDEKFFKLLSEQLDAQSRAVADLQKKLHEQAKNSTDKLDTEEKIQDIFRKAGITEQEVIDYIKELSSKNQDVPDYSSRRPDARERSANFERQISEHFDPDAGVVDAIAKLMANDVVYYSIGDTSKITKSKSPYSEYIINAVDLLMSKPGTAESFDALVKQVGLSDTNGYATLFNLSDEVFDDDLINWGRITCLYVFCGYMAKCCRNERVTELIIQFLGFYVSNRLGKWITENGGWDSCLPKKYDADTLKDKGDGSAMLSALLVGGLAAFAAAVFRR